jgi:glycerol kinase
VNILAIDQGTSATKALVVGPGNEVLGGAEVPVRTHQVGRDGVEADPEELWRSVEGAGARALESARAPVNAIALANQGETVLAWDPVTGKPLSRAIVWQDNRSAAVCGSLAGWAQELTAITGLPLDPYFAAPKMTWLRENVTRDGVVTTTDTWLLHRLGARYVTDTATASRTMLLDLDAAAWSPRACEAFGIDPRTLPEVADCDAVAGETTVFSDRPLPVAGIAVDQQAALFGQGCLDKGDAKCTYGTGAFLLVTTGSSAVRSTAGLSASVAWRLSGQAPRSQQGQARQGIGGVRGGRPPRSQQGQARQGIGGARGGRPPRSQQGRLTYCLDGQVYTAGSALRWLTSIGILDDPADLDAVAGTVSDSGGVVFVPALAGLGAPHWAPGAHGVLAGLQLSTERGHIARAVAEGIAAQRIARGRRADPLQGAAAGSGRSAASPGARVPYPARDRAWRRGPG